MLPWSVNLRGTFDEIVFESEALKDNPLGDPAQRPLWVYLPPGYADDASRRYPSIYLIQGLTGQLDMWRNRSAFRGRGTQLLSAIRSRTLELPIGRAATISCVCGSKCITRCRGNCVNRSVSS